MNIGAHIPSKNAIEEIKSRKGDTFQIFISSPQMWKVQNPVKMLMFYKSMMAQFMFMHHNLSLIHI